MAGDEHKEKVIGAIKAGRVSFRPRAEASIASMSPTSPDFTVTKATLAAAGQTTNGPWFAVEWETKSAGFGELTFFHRNGKLTCETESMSEEFVKAVLAKLADEAECI